MSNVSIGLSAHHNGTRVSIPPCGLDCPVSIDCLKSLDIDVWAALDSNAQFALCKQ